MGSALPINTNPIEKGQTNPAAQTGTVRVDDTVRAIQAAERLAAYYLVWRTRPSHPWHSEEFMSRRQAHQRFFELTERGFEAYLEKRHPERSE